MTRFLAILMILTALMLGGCSDSAKELFETAKLEELQNSTEHARQLYQEIIEKHPDSKFAALAKQRLEAMK